MVGKMIRFDEVIPGDVVGHYTDRPVDVTRISKVGQTSADPSVGMPGDVRLHFGEQAFIVDSPGRLIALLRRPWSEGRTEADMLNRVRYYARLTSEDQKDYNREKLREALDAYELGRPR